MSRAHVTVALIAVAALSLGGCESLRRAAGVEKTPPDEFSVVSRAPLELPPDYTLRPPRAGAARAQEVAPTEQARQTIFRAAEKDAAPSAASGNLSTGEAAILKQAGAGSTPSDIRRLVNQETTKLAQPDRSFVDSLIFWKEPAPPGTVIDPQKEAQRLHENAALGKKPDGGQKAEQGQTPPEEAQSATIERKQSSGFFGKLF